MIYFSIALVILFVFNVYLLVFLQKFINVVLNELTVLNTTQEKTIACINDLTTETIKVTKIMSMIDKTVEFEGHELKKIIETLNDNVVEQQASFVALNAHVQKLCVRRLKKNEDISCD